MKFLIIAQDLRVSGTSEGIVSRSFIANLRAAYPNSFIKVVYLKHSKSKDDLDLLPVDEMVVTQMAVKIPSSIKIINKFFWRIFHISLNDVYKYKSYGKHMAKIQYKQFDHIFIRSSGLEFETILGAKDLPILNKAIINFHDPFPLFWYTGSNTKPTGLELFRFQRMWEVIYQSKGCITPAKYLSADMEFLYGGEKHFYTIPHQYEEKIFNLSNNKKIFKKEKKLTLAYHGALQYGRNVEVLLDIYQELVRQSSLIAEKSEFVLRLKSSEYHRIKNKYQSIPNIRVLPGVNFSNSAYEQKYLVDINVLLENGPVYCNILLGKAPFLSAIGKPVFLLSPLRSELRDVISNKSLIGTYGNNGEIKKKLENLIFSSLKGLEFEKPFGDYFELPTFKNHLNEVLRRCS
ncbi:hypothetical protein ACNKXS_00205 [Christiangramia marina]|uniref:hypothetical protein n=1 Tax=Christiangramia marina TaxID=409436 RepID=UPI003AA833E4